MISIDLVYDSTVTHKNTSTNGAPLARAFRAPFSCVRDELDDAMGIRLHKVRKIDLPNKLVQQPIPKR